MGAAAGSRGRRTMLAFLVAAPLAAAAPRNAIEVAAKNAIRDRPARRAPLRRLDDAAAPCAARHYEVPAGNMEGGAHAGSMANPIVMTSGCPVSVDVARGTHAFFVIPGFDAPDDRGDRPMLRWEWRVDESHDETPFVGFSFSDQFPRYEGMSSDTFFDWYFWPLIAEDGVDFVEHEDGYDYYHCSGRSAPGRQYEGCQYYKTGDGTGARDVCPSCNPSRDLRAAGDGALRVGVSTWASAGPITVSYEATLYRNLASIETDDLAAVKELFLKNCWPWAAPTDWDWPRYQLEDREEVRGERDPRRKPHCDWWRGMTPEAVEAVTDCRDIEGVVCDADGRVSTIALETRGLRGALPASIAALPGLARVALENNRLNGTLPSFASEQLEVLRLSNNDFDGVLDCPASPSLRELTANRNKLAGPLPACLLNSPMLEILDLSSNPIGGALPPVTEEDPPLAVLFLAQTGLTGGLGPAANLTSLGRLDLSRNFLEGPLDASFLEGLPKLYELDLDWNRLSGPVPTFPDAVGLRRVDLGHNRFSGELGDQFDRFAANQDHGVISWLTLDDNAFCGPLPTVFYDLLYDSRYVLTGGGRNPLEVDGNRFRCAAVGGNRFFERWARATGHDFGECTPVAEPKRVAPADGHPVVMPGNDLAVSGSFVATTEATCAFATSWGRTAEAPAFYVSAEELRCRLPVDWPATETTVRVAHFCDDFSGPETLGDKFVEVAFVVANATAPPTLVPSPAPTAFFPTAAPVIAFASGGGAAAALSTAALSGVAAGGVALVFLALVLAFVVRRELAGKPIFVPVALEEENPMASSRDSPRRVAPEAALCDPPALSALELELPAADIVAVNSVPVDAGANARLAKLRDAAADEPGAPDFGHRGGDPGCEKGVLVVDDVMDELDL